MQFVDLQAQQKRIRTDIEKRIATVLDHGRYIMGPEVAELEKLLADYCGVRHAIGCASGTDALLIALMALGVGPGDAVFTTPFTFIATAEVVQLLGATPVFVDIEPATFNLDPDRLAAALKAAEQPDAKHHLLPRGVAGPMSPKAVIAVDLFGLPADYRRIRRLAREGGLAVIEDAAQSFGAEYEGARAGALADVGCTSFFPAKPLGGYGDGGMCFTEDDGLAAAMNSIRIHGKGADKYDNVRVGINGRLDTLQAAILLAKFSLFPEEITLRRRAAERYSRLLADIPGLTLPAVPQGCLSAWAQYSLLAASEEHRRRILAALSAEGVPTAVYYPTPLHLQTAFAHLGYHRGDFPNSEAAASRIFSLPMHPYLGADQQETIALAVRRAAS